MPLRIATPSDGAAFAAIFAPYVRDTVISFADVPPTPAEFAEKIASLQPRFPVLALEEDGVVRGYAYASPHRQLASYRWACETSIYLDQDHRGRGGGRRLYEALLAILRLQGFQRAYAGITLPNAASEALHVKLGFRAFARFEAVGFKRGRWLDVGWWDLALQPSLPVPPPEPSLFAAVQKNGSEALSRILAGSEVP